MSRLVLGCYQAGVRVGQALALFPSSLDWELPGDDHLRRAILTHLSAAVALLPRNRGESATVRLAESCLAQWQAVVDRNTVAVNAFLSIRQHLLSISNLIHDGLSQEGGLALARLSFQLGTKIVDGSDETISNGTPSITVSELDPDRPESAYPRLTFRESRGPSWQWRDASRVRNLLEQLKVDEDLVFPPYESLTDIAWTCLPNLPLYFWGWAAVEQGLDAIRHLPRPRWDDQRRQLFVGEVVVRTYRKIAENQIRLLNSLENADWRQGVTNPLHGGPGPSRMLNQTLQDLNAAINPRLIHFSADGSGRIIYEIDFASAASEELPAIFYLRLSQVHLLYRSKVQSLLFDSSDW